VTVRTLGFVERISEAIMKQSYHTYYDPISGYIHKFRLDEAAPVSDDAPQPVLIIAASIASVLLLLIAALTL
jgi:hypothetical protein